jgi:hypothetical protein
LIDFERTVDRDAGQQVVRIVSISRSILPDPQTEPQSQGRLVFEPVCTLQAEVAGFVNEEAHVGAAIYRP